MAPSSTSRKIHPTVRMLILVGQSHWLNAAAAPAAMETRISTCSLAFVSAPLVCSWLWKVEVVGWVMVGPPSSDLVALRSSVSSLCADFTELTEDLMDAKSPPFASLFSTNWPDLHQSRPTGVSEEASGAGVTVESHGALTYPGGVLKTVLGVNVVDEAFMSEIKFETLMLIVTEWLMGGNWCASWIWKEWKSCDWTSTNGKPLIWWFWWTTIQKDVSVLCLEFDMLNREQNLKPLADLWEWRAKNVRWMETLLFDA